MDTRSLAKIDLNLLLALQVLLEERSVSRAAERLFVTQSAMSKSLGRLRELFDDPLFTRSGGQMVPTPRTEQIATELGRVLRGVEGIVLPAEFDPRLYEGEFLIEIPGYLALWVFPILFRDLAAHAPGIRIDTLAGDEHHLDLMAAGKLDFAIQIERETYPPQFRVMTLGFAPPRLMVRRDHPLAGTRPGWDDILAYPQIRLHIPDIAEAKMFSRLDVDFVGHLSERESTLRTQHISVALEVVLATDFIFPGPPFFIDQSDLSEEVVALPIPGDQDISVRFVIVYHERVAQSPAHQYLLSRITGAVESYRVRNGLPDLTEMRALRNLDE
jgi:DNA-binding transcriptional LysR family regulator